MITFIYNLSSLLTIPVVTRLIPLSLGYEPRALSATPLMCTDDVLPDTHTYNHIVQRYTTKHIIMRRLDFCAVVQRRLLPLSLAYCSHSRTRHTHFCTRHAHFCARRLHSPSLTTRSTPHHPPITSPTGHRVTTLVWLPWVDFQPSG